VRIPIEFEERADPFSWRREGIAPHPRGNARRYSADGFREAARMQDMDAQREAFARDAGPQAAWGEAPAEEKTSLRGPPPAAATAAESGAPSEEKPPTEDAQEWRERYLRLKADLENVRRHAEADKFRLTTRGKDAVLEDIFPIVDHMERALRAARDAGENPGVLQGIEMVRDELLTVLEKHGVRKIETVGKPFDPRVHDAVSVQEHPDFAKNTVVAELCNGFMRGENLLRPAHVIVAA